MKKFFSIILTAALALVSVPSCCGGGDKDEAVRVTVEQFAAGSKYIELRTGNGTVFITPRIGASPYPLDINTTDADGNGVKGKYGVGGTVKHGTTNPSHDATFNYTVTYNAEGVATKANLSITLTDTPDAEDPICDFLGIEGVVDDDDNDEEDPTPTPDPDNPNAAPAPTPTTAIEIELNYDTRYFKVTDGTEGYIYAYPQ